MPQNKIAPNDAVPSEGSKTGISGGDVLNKMGELFSIVREGQITKREMERYRAMREVAIMQILEQSRIAEKLIDKVFEERRRVIEKHFEVIDKGMAQNDYSLINAGLQSVTELVKENPFKLFQLTTAPQRHKMLEDGEFSLE